MTAAPSQRRAAEVWGSTRVPGPSPVDGFGNAAGYSVAWVRVHDGPMLQVVVDADTAPAPGVTGEVWSTDVGDETIDVFTPAAGARR